MVGGTSANKVCLGFMFEKGEKGKAYSKILKPNSTIFSRPRVKPHGRILIQVAGQVKKVS